MPSIVLDPVEPRRELLDRAQPGRALADRVEQAGVRDGDRHLARERRAQLQLVRRPVVRRPVVEHEQAERLVALNTSGTKLIVRNPGGRRCSPKRGGLGAVQHDASAARRWPAGPMAGSSSRRRAATASISSGSRSWWAASRSGMATGCDEPQGGGVGAEQGPGGVEDVVEDLVQLQVGADLGHDPAQRERSRLQRAGTQRPHLGGRRDLLGRETAARPGTARPCRPWSATSDVGSSCCRAPVPCAGLLPSIHGSEASWITPVGCQLAPYWAEGPRHDRTEVRARG